MAKQKSYLFIKSENKYIKINLDKVLFFEEFKAHIEIHFQDNEKTTLSPTRLKSLEEFLQNKFMRVHRSFIINLEMIEAVESNQLNLGTRNIKVAEKYKHSLYKYLISRTIN